MPALNELYIAWVFQCAFLDEGVPLWKTPAEAGDQLGLSEVALLAKLTL
ncbi:MAG: hypothetical protein R3F53_21260 [Gammaproteobacteria bacterium]